ncbi:MAG: class I SAM-dependent methyltransferase [Melioribacteraceae bacterium]|nr:class I SAM-dependent methyltransferase [Melioribacteraceae bacterium]MCF8353672.1 class I SAM-dependent methyltransferase [Melioribacteraceae bacterium]MCF8394454.1 class I SAM-dependent methyltransferase [Melioribacteraceae bacterium]MCF8418588.1 class I SAM-dependent methyltransferase [Melioribacteraceae bacterium]
MEIKDAYNNWSSTYDDDKNLTRDLDEKVTRKILNPLKVKSTLEIGCGTGKNTEMLAKISGKVLAIDFSERMIERAKEKIKSGNVEFKTADITNKWDVPDDSFELITCNLVLEHIENLDFIFAEASRSLVKGGNLFVSELHPFRQYVGKKANFEREGEKNEIHSLVHNISDFLNSAARNGFTLVKLDEWHNDNNEIKLPRLITFLFNKK